MSIEEKINRKNFNWFRLEKDYFSKHTDLFEKYYDICNVDELYKYQTLDQNFIRKYQEKLDWKKIIKYQKLAQNFIIEFEA